MKLKNPLTRTCKYKKWNSFFFNHVKNVIFKENKPRTLKGPLEYYNKIVENYSFKKCERTSLLKEMLQKEFGQSIGFHNCFQKYESCIVFVVSKGGTCIEAAISSRWYVKKYWPKYSEKAKIFTNMEWLPHPYQLEKVSTLSDKLEVSELS